MAVPRTATPEDFRPTARAPDWSTAGPPYRPVAVPFPDQLLWGQVIRCASCATSRLDPEDWFPVNVEIGKARREAAAAIAVCITCPVRAQCLTLSLRHWDIGQHGVWGGMVPAERVALRRLLHVDATNAARNAPILRAGRPAGRRPRDQLTGTTQNVPVENPLLTGWQTQGVLSLAAYCPGSRR
jgi:WhiB family transcriptional regulator, redox-sensing transcriptional regulator